MKLRAALFGKNFLSFCLMLLLEVIIVNALAFLVYPFAGNWSPWLQFVSGYGLQTIVSLIIIYLWFIRRFPEEQKNISFQSPPLLRLIGYVFLIFVSYFVFVFLVFTISKYLGYEAVPGFGDQVSLLAALGEGRWLIVVFILAVLVAPIIEEYMFRGWGMICLPSSRYPVLAIVLNSLLFALLHFQPQSVLPLLFLGIMLAFVRLKSNSLLPGIIFHVLNNSLAFWVDYSLR